MKRSVSINRIGNRAGDAPADGGLSIMARTPRILIVHHDPLLKKSLSLFFMKQGYDVDRASTAHEAFAVLQHHRPVLIVLDLRLPDLDGRTVCSRVRQTSDVPIIVLSDKSDYQDKVSALEQGADDYVSEPFNAEELVARVRLALRRVASENTGCLDLGALVIDFDRRRVTVGGNKIRLTPSEFELLVLLARHPNHVLPRRGILTAIWGKPAIGRPERLWALIARLRRKIEPDPERPRYVLSDPWVGYRLVTEPDPPVASAVNRAVLQERAQKTRTRRSYSDGSV
jgi:two-component system KDP operon response regulator KdpE